MMSHYFNFSLQIRKWRLKHFLLCTIMVLLPLQALFAVEVITHSDNVVQVQGSHDLRSIFSMRTRYWPNGEKIRVFVLPDDHKVHKAFVKQNLQMFPHQLRRTWNRMTYTGTGQPPVTVYSIPEMLEKIKTTKNSIGYIDRRIEDEDIHFFDAQ
jgi:ABC-type phosphate transport system substrate-binding protein